MIAITGDKERGSDYQAVPTIFGFCFSSAVMDEK